MATSEEATRSAIVESTPASEAASDAAPSSSEDAPAALLPGGYHRFAPVLGEESTAVTNTLKPPTDALLTIRVIKSFAYRTMKAAVLQHLDLTQLTVDQLKALVKEEVKTKPAFKAFRNKVDELDTIKIYTRAHGSKTSNLIINLDHPEWILDDGDKKLIDCGCENEVELSLFNRAEYEAFLKDPTTTW